jgi:DNA-binding response OmpR family regulator
MKGSVFVVHWKSSETRKLTRELKKEGWVVEAESQNVMRAFERIKRKQPNAVVIYLNRKPKRGREVGFTLKSIKMTNHLPVVFVTSQDIKKKWAKKRVPEATFVNADELNKTLEKYCKVEEEN